MGAIIKEQYTTILRGGIAYPRPQASVIKRSRPVRVEELWSAVVVRFQDLLGHRRHGTDLGRRVPHIGRLAENELEAFGHVARPISICDQVVRGTLVSLLLPSPSLSAA